MIARPRVIKLNQEVKTIFEPNEGVVSSVESAMI